MQRPHLLSSGITTENGRAMGGQCEVQAAPEDIISGPVGQRDILAASLASNFVSRCLFVCLFVFISRCLKATLATVESLCELSEYRFLDPTLLESASIGWGGAQEPIFLTHLQVNLMSSQIGEPLIRPRRLR